MKIIINQQLTKLFTHENFSSYVIKVCRTNKLTKENSLASVNKVPSL